MALELPYLGTLATSREEDDQLAEQPHRRHLHAEHDEQHAEQEQGPVRECRDAQDPLNGGFRNPLIPAIAGIAESLAPAAGSHPVRNFDAQ